MASRSLNVPLLHTGNSAYSLPEEAQTEDPAIDIGKSGGDFSGGQPKGQPHPLALALNAPSNHGGSRADLRSKSGDALAASGAPGMDPVFPNCGGAAGEPPLRCCRSDAAVPIAGGAVLGDADGAAGRDLLGPRRVLQSRGRRAAGRRRPR